MSKPTYTQEKLKRKSHCVTSSMWRTVLESYFHNFANAPLWDFPMVQPLRGLMNEQVSCGAKQRITVVSENKC